MSSPCYRSIGFANAKGQAWLWTIVVLALIIAAGYYGANQVTVPYTVSEVYQEQEPYTAVQEYTVQEPYTLKVPHTDYRREEVLTPVSTLGVSSGEPRPYSYNGKDCSFRDYEYTVQYFDGSENDAVSLSDAGYSRSRSTSVDPLRAYLSRFDDYEPGTDIGFNERTNILTAAALICNLERASLQGRFAICKYSDGKKGTCQNSFLRRISPEQCHVIYMPWYTRDAVGKSLRIEPVAISQKFACKPKGRADFPVSNAPLDYASESTFRQPGPVSTLAPDYETVYLKMDRGYFRPYYESMFQYYADLQGSHPPIITRSGTLGIPRKYRFSPPLDVTKSGVVTSAVRKTYRQYPVTTYVNETGYRNVTKTDVVTAYRDVDKKREVTKYRTLWEEILLRIGVALPAR